MNVNSLTTNPNHTNVHFTILLLSLSMFRYIIKLIFIQNTLLLKSYKNCKLSISSVTFSSQTKTREKKRKKEKKRRKK